MVCTYTRTYTLASLSLFITITNDVTGANNVIPLRTPSHSAHSSLSFLSAISHSSSPSSCRSRSRCMTICAPTYVHGSLDTRCPLMRYLFQFYKNDACSSNAVFFLMTNFHNEPNCEYIREAHRVCHLALNRHIKLF